jgi:ankyrin repeat protein
MSYQLTLPTISISCDILLNEFMLATKYSKLGNNFEIVKNFIKNGIDKNEKIVKNYTVLEIAIFNIDKYCTIETIELLLESGINVNNKDTHNRIPLLHAINKNSLDLVKLLIKYGANINHKNNENYTPICYAISNNYFEIIKLLVDEGCDINHELKGCVSILAYTLELSQNDNNFEIVKYLLEKGAKINEKNIYGKNLLMFCAGDNIETMKLLIYVGCDINMIDDNGNNILYHMMTYDRNIQMIRLLLYYNVNLNSLCEDDKKYIDNLCYKGDYYKNNIYKLNSNNFIDQELLEIKVKIEFNKVFIKKLLKKKINEIFYKPNNLYNLLLDLNYNIEYFDDNIKEKRFDKIKLLYGIESKKDFIKFKNNNINIFI